MGASFQPTMWRATRSVAATSTSSNLQELGFSQAEIENADMAEITPQADVYYLPGGTAVTTSLYHVLPNGKTKYLVGVDQVRNTEFLRPGGSNITMTVSLYTINRENVHI